MKEDPRLLYVRQAERLYRVGHGVIRAMVLAKRLRGIRRGARTLVSAKQVEELLGVNS